MQFPTLFTSWFAALFAIIALVICFVCLYLYHRKLLSIGGEQYAVAVDLYCKNKQLREDKALLEERIQNQKKQLDGMEGDMRRKLALDEELADVQSQILNKESLLQSYEKDFVELEIKKASDRETLRQLREEVAALSKQKEEIEGIAGRKKNELEELQNRVGSVRNELEEKKGELAEILRQSDDAARTKAELEVKSGSLHQLVFSLEQRKEECEKSIQQLSQRKMELETLIEQQRQNQKPLEDKISSVEEELKAVLEARDAALAKKKDVEEEIALLKQDKENLHQTTQVLEDSRSKLEARIRESEDQLSTLNRRVADASEELHSTQTQLGTALSTKSDAEIKTDALYRNISSLEEEQKKLAQTIDKLGGEKDALEKSIQAISQNKVDLDALIEQEEQKLKSLEENCASEVEKCEDARQAREAALAEKKTVEEETASLKQEQEDIHQAKQGLEYSLFQLEAKNRESKEQLSSLLKEVETTSEALRTTKMQIESVLTDKSEIEKKAEDLRWQIVSLEGKKNSLDEEISERNDKLAGLGRRIDAEAERLNNLNQDISVLRTTRDSLQEQGDSLERSLDALYAEKVSLEHAIKKLHGKGESGTLEDTSLDGLYIAPESLKQREICDDDMDEIKMLDTFRRSLQREKLIFPERTIYAFHTALKCQSINPLTVLAGVSGTGKTLLPVKYAEFMGMNQTILAVQPRWDSPQDMFGFYNYLEKRYKATELSRWLLRMDPYRKESDDEYRVFDDDLSRCARKGMLMVLLDEMNLARPEYYFSEFLSKLELRRSCGGDKASRSKAKIELDTGAGNKPLSLWVPENVLFVGTMNEDESTQALSDKVLDRANVLRFGKPKKADSQTSVHQLDSVRPSTAESNGGFTEDRAFSAETWKKWRRTNISDLDDYKQYTEDINDHLAKLGRPFGYRVEQAIYTYVSNYPSRGTEGKNFAYADQIEQKILPKLRGCEMQHELDNCLDLLMSILADLKDEELAKALRQARDASDHTGIFQWQGVSR